MYCILGSVSFLLSLLKLFHAKENQDEMWFQPVERAEQNNLMTMFSKCCQLDGWYIVKVGCPDSELLRQSGRSLVKVYGLESISLTRNRATTQTVIAGIDDQMDGIIEYSSVDVV